MRRERLKDRIEDSRDSLLDLFLKGTVALVCIAAVVYALIGRTPAVAPGAKTATNQASLTLTATRNHCFYWNQEGPIPVADFGGRLAALRQTVPAPRVVITGDASARLGDAMDLFNEAKRQGVDARIEAFSSPQPK